MTHFEPYSSSETINEFMKRVSQFNIQMNKAKYKLILNFINEVTNQTYKSLADFKRFPSSKLKNDKQIMDKYADIFSKELHIDKFELMRITNEPGPGEDIVLYIRKVLDCIDYQLITTCINNKIYYSIITSNQF